MTVDTDAYEVDPRDYADMNYRRDNDNRNDRDRRPFNGSTKAITTLLALMNILTAAAIVGGVVMYGKVTSLDDKVTLIIEGRIRIPSLGPAAGQ